MNDRLKQLGAAVLLVVVAFLLGWYFGGGSGDAPAAPAASSGVELRLDAGALTLLPEGGLELPPITPIDAGADRQAQ